jgi:hypothetical protein
VLLEIPPAFGTFANTGLKKLELTTRFPEISKIQKIIEKVGYSLKFEEEMKKEKAMLPHNSNNFHHSISILIERVVCPAEAIQDSRNEWIENRERT